MAQVGGNGGRSKGTGGGGSSGGQAVGCRGKAVWRQWGKHAVCPLLPVPDG